MTKPQPTPTATKECPFHIAMERLHAPDLKYSGFVGRNSERDQFREFCESRIRTGTSGGIYIHGSPGTGKTLTVRTVLQFLEDRYNSTESYLSIPKKKRRTSTSTSGNAHAQNPISWCVINCMNIEPTDIYGQILSQAFGECSPPSNSEDALILLRQYSLSASGDVSSSSSKARALSAAKPARGRAGMRGRASMPKREKPKEKRAVGGKRTREQSPDGISQLHFVVLDEIDGLVSRSDVTAGVGVLHTLYELAWMAGSRLVLVGIANTLCRDDSFLRNLKEQNSVIPFTAYTSSQISGILRQRVSDISSLHACSQCDEISDPRGDCEGECRPLFSPIAIEFIAKKSAGVSGDARRALALLSSSLRIAQRGYRTSALTHTAPTLSSAPLLPSIAACSRADASAACRLCFPPQQTSPSSVSPSSSPSFSSVEPVPVAIWKNHAPKPSSRSLSPCPATSTELHPSASTANAHGGSACCCRVLPPATVDLTAAQEACDPQLAKIETLPTNQKLVLCSAARLILAQPVHSRASKSFALTSHFAGVKKARGPLPSPAAAKKTSKRPLTLERLYASYCSDGRRCGFSSLPAEAFLTVCECLADASMLAITREKKCSDGLDRPFSLDVSPEFVRAVVMEDLGLTLLQRVLGDSDGSTDTATATPIKKPHLFL